MAVQRVQVDVSFSYPQTVWVAASSGGSPTSSYSVYVPASGSAVSIVDRNTNNPATVFAAKTGGSTISSLTTDAGGNVPGWVVEGSYQITAAAAGGFAGATVGWEAVRGDGVENLAAGAVTNASLSSAVVQQLVPTGTILDFGGGSAPTGFLLCNGLLVSQSTWPALYAVIGSTWNTGGETAGTFRLPDLRGRVAVGAGAGPGLTSRTVGPSSVGAESVAADLAAHIHGANVVDNGHSHFTTDPGHSHPLVDGSHYHTFLDNSTGNPNAELPTVFSAAFMTQTASGFFVWGVSHGCLRTVASTSNTSVNGAFTGLTVDNAIANVTVGITSAGAGGGHNNMQPFNVVTKIIKT